MLSKKVEIERLEELIKQNLKVSIINNYMAKNINQKIINMCNDAGRCENDRV